MHDAIPNLPGYKAKVWNEDHRRKPAFEIVDGVRIQTCEDSFKPKPKMVQVPKTKHEWRDGALPRSTARDIHRPLVKELDYTLVPASEALEGFVLRYYGYFTEAVVESNLETRLNQLPY